MENLNTFLSNATGNGAPMLVNGQLVNNTNATLRHEEWKMYDTELLKIARQRLTITQDLKNRGLVKNLGGIGTILSMWERSGDMQDATISLDGKTKGLNDRVTFDQVGVPVPVVSADWEVDARHLEASRKLGEPLDTTQMQIATRRVADRIEQMIIEGVPGLTVAGQQIYGYTTHPNRNTGTISSGWQTANGLQIVSNVKDMLQQAYDQNYFGPFVLYVAKDIWANIQTDYSAEKGDNTIKDRIEAFVDIDMVMPGDSLASGTVVMVQLTSDVVDLAIGQDLRNIQWSTEPMATKYKIFSVLAPRVKAEKDGRCGVVHWTS